MPIIRRTLPIVLLMAVLAVVIIVPPTSTQGQMPLDDSFQPIIVSGAVLGPFLGAPVAELFVYVFHDGGWEQIPYQIDEKAANEDGERVYAAEGNGSLDADEEVVFVLGDMGERAQPSEWVEGAQKERRIELGVRAAGGDQRWAYLYRSSELAPSFADDYVRFSGAAQRVIAGAYEAGFLDNGVGLNELRLNGSGVDILDRTKIRLNLVVLGLFRRLITEDDLEPRPTTPVKDGPVRLVMEETGGFAYERLYQQQEQVDLADLPVPGATVERLRFSWDFSEAVAPATSTSSVSLDAQSVAIGVSELGSDVATLTPTVYLDPNLDAPVVIDGQPDDVPATPLPLWRQISHATGTIVMLADLSSVGGTQRNYYKDDASVDTDDTGDQRSYGDTGFEVDNPSSSFTLSTSLLVLPPTDENVGAPYAELLAKTPTVLAVPQPYAGLLDRSLYLPLIQR